MENTINRLKNIEILMADILQELKSVSGIVGTGLAGREIAISITKLQDTTLWIKEAERMLMAQPATSGSLPVVEKGGEQKMDEDKKPQDDNGNGGEESGNPEPAGSGDSEPSKPPEGGETPSA